MNHLYPMKKFALLIVTVTLVFQCLAQTQGLPKGYSAEEKERIARGDIPTASAIRGIAAPPPFDQLRSMAEWEEIEALTIAWTSFPSILKQIVAAAQPECRVLILTMDPQETEDYLTGANEGGPALNMENIELIVTDFNSIWIRDYAGNPVYGSEVDDLVMVDWKYNRITRPDDDASPQAVADHLGLTLYTMTEAPDDLVNTGGNWMSDGFGTAFASKLILEENEAGNPYGVSVKSEVQIDGIVEEYLGIDRYIKMETLPYDGIHHIDMHMKLLDEETLLIGEYPEGIADGPQINANMEYVLSNFTSKWGTPYRVIRIPMPDSPSGLWPSSEPTPAHYRTYTNAVFVNNTIILPTYREEYDTTALRIWRESMPGYRVIGIDCDNQGSAIIAQSGAIHCITHSVGVQDPLLISHQPLRDTDNTVVPYEVSAYINHRSGIASARLFWKTNPDADYLEVPMVEAGSNTWTAFIPAQPQGTRIYYYIQGTSESGKVQDRPMPAPEGYWSFAVNGAGVGVRNSDIVAFSNVFPNPASAITCIVMNLTAASDGELALYDINGRKVLTIYQGQLGTGERKHFIDANLLAPGAYVIRWSGSNGSDSLPLLVK